MRSDAIQIDLKEHVGPGVKALNTRTWGIALRNSLQLESIEGSYNSIQIKIPIEINSINSIFFEELLENVIHKLGVENFKEKFSFVSDGHYAQAKIDSYVDEAINSLLVYA